MDEELKVALEKISTFDKEKEEMVGYCNVLLGERNKAIVMLMTEASKCDKLTKRNKVMHTEIKDLMKKNRILTKQLQKK